MAALSADRITNYQGEARQLDMPVVASDIVYKGGLVSVVKGTGYAGPAIDAANHVVAGIALENADNSSGSAGDINCLVASGIVAELDTGSDLGQGSVGKTVYVTDDQTVDLESNFGIPVGTVVKYVSSSAVKVYIPPYLDSKSVPLEAGVRYTDVQVTTAQVLALNATPISLVAAPGAGRVLIFEGAFLHLDYNATAYGGIAAGEDLAISYTNGSGQEVGRCETTGFLDATADAIRWVPAQSTTAAVNQITPVANAALVISLLVGEITTGDSPLNVRTFYRDIPSTLSP